MQYLETNGSRVWVARTRVDMNVWLCWLRAVLNLDWNGVPQCSLSKFGGRQLLTRPGAEAPTGHKGFGVKDEESPGYFFVVIDEFCAHIYVTSGSHSYIHYSGAQIELLRGSPVTKGVEILPIFFLLGHGSVQRSGSGWRAEHSLRYQSYLIPDNPDLPDAIASA